MKVTRLEIFGFKSFLERFVLNFDKNMIGIVGPNGCGKSNVVDALRWVLGETHAKQLRGGSFEDLLFNGTENKRPLGMAEVSLTIQPDSDWDKKIKAQSDLTEAISQLDKLEDEFEKNVGSKDEESSEENSSEETQAIAEPENEPLSIISKRIMEIPGIFDVAEIQFTRRLYRSGESEYFINKVPCRLKDLQDVYRLIGLGARGLSIVQQGQIGQFISRKPLERRELLEEAAGISGFRNKMEAASRRLDKTNDNLARATDIITEVEKQVRSLKKQAQRAMARQSLKDELYTSEKELFSLKSSQLVHVLDDKERTKSSLEQQVEEQSAHIDTFEAQILEFDGLLHEAEAAILELRREKDVHSRTLLEQEARIQNIRVNLASLQSQEQNIQGRMQDGEKRVHSINGELETLVQEAHKIQVSIEENSKSRESQKRHLEKIKEENKVKIETFIENSKQQVSGEGLEGNASSVSSRINETNEKITEKESFIQNSDDLHKKANAQRATVKDTEQNKIALERKLTKIESESSAIERQISTFKDHALKAVGSNTNTDPDSKILLSILSVPKEYERPVHAILGERAEYLISKDSKSMLNEYMQRNQNKKKTGIISHATTQLSSNTESETFNDSTSLQDVKAGKVHALLEVIQCEEAYRATIDSIFAHTYYAENIAAAEELQTHLSSHNVKQYTITLPGGEIITPWGWYSTEGEGVHFSFVRRLQELTLESDSLKAEITIAAEKVAEEEATLKALLEDVETLNRSRNELSQLQKELSSLLKTQADEERKKAEEIRQQERSLRDQLQSLEAKESSILRNIEQDGMRLESNLKNVTNQKERLQKEIDQIEESTDSFKDKLEEIQRQIASTNESISRALESSSSDETAELKTRLSELEKTIEKNETDRLSIQKDLGQIRYEQSEARRTRENIERNLRSVTSEVDRATIELEMLKAEFDKQYPEDTAFDIPEITTAIQTLESYTEQHDKLIRSLSETSQSIRKRLEREGEVDPQSIELYEQEEARLNSMTKQIADLKKAKETLERTIRQLKELSRIRFIETFKVVNDKFKELVPRLFAGGSGHLELINPDDPLQSGVNIIVRPPGKKITTMELMSGGEKALVATAVLVAVFLHHPGPICVLDEVDAPLDDANLGRFLELIREISDRTQFLIITHNKLTMQAVDRLVGITMQERGVTTAISVDLEEAEEEIEKWIASAA